MIQTGVDSLSRMGEFVVKWSIYKRFKEMLGFGVRAGSSGYTLDLFASRKPHKCRRYAARGAPPGAVGDARTFAIAHWENVWAVPPLPLIQMVVEQLCSLEACSAIVVPDWPDRPWHVHLRLHCKASESSPLSWHPASQVMWDVSDRSNSHPHLVDKWDFVAFAVGAGGDEQPLGLQQWRPKAAKSASLSREKVVPQLRRKRKHRALVASSLD